ncbi:hypothetical protein MCC10106_1949 [Bifidobacterium longum subsp. longum]|uniref:hypothetical protein n=1 Tax=Bifidobacterium longum TaxID=216816 RepID=UPI00103A5C2A|nr:hypothetical protein [Bifidobacterium longum]TCF46626.1 hypothetical protein MCC10106_1949 [Bifidobacterium longum subsp. longum]
MAKQQNTAPSIAEFEDWDEIREAEALAEVANQVKVRHIIKNNEYWALTPGGTVYKLPLYLSIADFEALSGASTDTDSLDQVKRILTVFAGDEQAKQLEREPMQVAFNLIQDYGETLAKSQGVELGKSPTSAESSTPMTE